MVNLSPEKQTSWSLDRGEPRAAFGLPPSDMGLR